MKFFDQVDIIVQSWKWGNGVISWRREKGEPRWGPAGGDGGRGWSVLIKASKDEHTLLQYRYKHKFKAKEGQPWQSREKYWAAWDDIQLLVPLGTLIKEKSTGNILAHMKQDGELFVVCKWWKGGAWNIHFKNPNNQYPQIALYGEPGEIKELTLELQLLGDVALVWTPSVGKSTLINAVSNVKAKTADYEFTTLVPNIGIVERKQTSFVMVDVPGLIEWASSGKWLGNMFLRHILKAKIWTVMLDARKDLPGIEEWALLVHEIVEYVDNRFIWSSELWIVIDNINHEFSVDSEWIIRYHAMTTIQEQEHILLKKAIVTIVNKYDLLDEELREEYKSSLEDHITTTLQQTYQVEHLWSLQLHTLSALARIQIDRFLNLCISLVNNNTFVTFLDTEVFEIDVPTDYYVRDVSDLEIEWLLEEWYIKESHAKFSKVREVYHPMAWYLTFVLPWWNEEAELRYWKTMSKEWILKLCEKAGARIGDIFKIKSVYAWHDDKYILRE